MSHQCVRRHAATLGLCLSFLLTGAAVASASDYDRDGSATPADCDDFDAAILPGAGDRPDLAFEDANCDGIDGDLTKAIFVDKFVGADAQPGTRDAPMYSLAAALPAAKAAGKDIYITGGFFTEPLALEPDMGIYGGYASGFATRQRDRATILGAGTTGALADGDTGVELQLLTLSPYDGRVGDTSSYGLRAINGATVLLEEVEARGSNGGAGIYGENGGRPTTVPAAGGAGQSGACGTGQALGGTPAVPEAGTGGTGGTALSQTGGDGTAATGPLAGLGGIGAPFGGNPTGITGGTHGTPGTGGANTKFTLERARETWLGGDGEAGGDGGTGGAGGGGGGGFGASAGGIALAGGGAGGGGGQGGEGGFGGKPGTSGGGSFAIYIYDAKVVAVNSTLRARAGGRGGDGGRGGAGIGGGRGGTGGQHVVCEVTVGTDTFRAESRAGQAGGRGGSGGSGGDAGAGAGGPAAGVFRAGAASAYAARNTSISVLRPGEGGSAGTAQGAADGVAQNLLEASSAPLLAQGDFDGDGAGDLLDGCPAVPAPGNGCPARAPRLVDSDGDGIPDGDDPCPLLPPGALDANGDGCADPASDPGPGPRPGDEAPPQLERLTARITFSHRRPGKRTTRLTRFVVRDIPKGSTVRVTCKGRGCFKAVTKRNVSGTLELKAQIRKPLRAGTRITVTVSRAGAVSAVRTLTIRKARKPLVRSS